MGKNIFFILTTLSSLFWSGCGGGSGGDALTGSTGLPVKNGVFLDSAVEGINYVTDSLSGQTDPLGVFRYREGEKVSFFINTLLIGSSSGKAMITPIDIVPGAVDDNDPTVVNICRLLQSVDADDNPENGIAILPSVAEIVSKRAIDFTRSPEGFSDETLTELFADLNSRRLFGNDTVRHLRSIDETVAHFRKTLHEVAFNSSEANDSNYSDLSLPLLFSPPSPEPHPLSEYLSENGLSGKISERIELLPYGEQTPPRFTNGFPPLKTRQESNAPLGFGTGGIALARCDNQLIFSTIGSFSSFEEAYSTTSGDLISAKVHAGISTPIVQYGEMEEKLNCSAITRINFSKVNKEAVLNLNAQQRYDEVYDYLSYSQQNDFEGNWHASWLLDSPECNVFIEGKSELAVSGERVHIYSRDINRTELYTADNGASNLTCTVFDQVILGYNEIGSIGRDGQVTIPGNPSSNNYSTVTKVHSYDITLHEDGTGEGAFQVSMGSTDDECRDLPVSFTLAKQTPEPALDLWTARTRVYNQINELIGDAQCDDSSQCKVIGIGSADNCGFLTFKPYANHTIDKKRLNELADWYEYLTKESESDLFGSSYGLTICGYPQRWPGVSCVENKCQLR